MVVLAITHDRGGRDWGRLWMLVLVAVVVPWVVVIAGHDGWFVVSYGFLSS